MWRKNFRNRKLQTLLLFFVVMLCSLLMCSAGSIMMSMKTPYYDLAKECETMDMRVYPGSYVDDEVEAFADDLKKLKEVESVETYRFHFNTEELNTKNGKVRGFNNLIEYNDKVYGSSRIIEGNKDTLLPLKEGECLLPVCIAIDMDLSVGDTITLKASDKEYSFKIKGLFSEPYSASTAFSSAILVNKIPDELFSSLEIALNIKEGYADEDIETDYRELHDGVFPGQCYSLDSQINDALMAGTILGSILLAIGIIMLIVSGMIINFMIQNTILNDAKKIATYKTIGYQFTDILKMYLLFYFVVVSAGCLLGIVCSNLLSVSVLTSMFQNIGAKVQVESLLVGCLCFLGVDLFVLGIIAALLSKTRRIKPVFALNGFAPENTKKKKKYKGNMNISFSAFGIAVRNLVRDKKGAIGIIITSIVTIFGINFAIISLNVALTLKENNDYWLSIDPGDINIEISPGVAVEEIEDLLKDNSHIEKTIPSSFSYHIFQPWKKGITDTIIYPVVYQNFDIAGMEAIEGRNPVKGDEVAITGLIREETGKEIGDYMDIIVGGKKKSFLITGLFQTYYNMGRSCRIVPAAFDDTDIEYEDSILSIYLNEESDINEELKWIEKQIDGKGKVFLRTERYASIMEMISEPQKKALPSLVLLILLIGGINIFGIVLLKNMNYQKQNGRYKCIGYSTRHLICSNIWYVMILAAISLVIAVPTVLNLYPLIMKGCLSVFGLVEYRIAYQPTQLMLCNASVFAMFLFSTLLSSWGLRKIDVRELTQE